MVLWEHRGSGDSRQGNSPCRVYSSQTRLDDAGTFLPLRHQRVATWFIASVHQSCSETLDLARPSLWNFRECQESRVSCRYQKSILATCSACSVPLGKHIDVALLGPSHAISLLPRSLML